MSTLSLIIIWVIVFAVLFSLWRAIKFQQGSTARVVLHNGAVQPFLKALLSGGDPSHLPPADVPNEGVKVGEVIGHRIWRLGQDGLLYPFFKSMPWLPDQPMEGDVHKNGGEGIWAFKSQVDACEKMAKNQNTVRGTVKLWGDIVEHEDGYRAQFARVASIEDMNTIEMHLHELFCDYTSSLKIGGLVDEKDIKEFVADIITDIPLYKPKEQQLKELRARYKV